MNARNELRKEAAAKLVIGHRFGRCVGVEGTNYRESNSRVFIFRCDCGCLFQRSINDIRRTTKRGGSPACAPCARRINQPARTRVSGAASCDRCCGLAHRRPKRGLCACKLPRVELAPIELPRTGGGSWRWL